MHALDANAIGVDRSLVSGGRVVVDPSGGGVAFENLGWGKKTGSLIDNAEKMPHSAH